MYNLNFPANSFSSTSAFLSITGDIAQTYFFLNIILEARCPVRWSLGTVWSVVCFQLAFIPTSNLFRPAWEVYFGSFKLLRSPTYVSAEVSSPLRSTLYLIGLSLPLDAPIIYFISVDWFKFWKQKKWSQQGGTFPASD